MSLLGQSHIGDTPTPLGADVKLVGRFSLPAPAYVAKLSAYLDGDGGGLGSQPVRAVVYDAGGALVLSSETVSVADGAAPAWVDLRLAISGGVSLAAGDYDVGLHSGAPANVIRAYASVAATAMSGADSFGDGASDPFGTSSAEAIAYSVFATLFTPWSAPDVEDEQIARWPFLEAQRILADAGTDATTKLSAACGWHGTGFDPETGSNAIVRTDGPLADRVGERVLVTYGRLAVAAYVHTEADIAEDISLTRMLFGRLAPLATDELEVTVETLQ